jgi:hypothetical protein
MMIDNIYTFEPPLPSLPVGSLLSAVCRCLIAPKECVGADVTAFCGRFTPDT